MMTMQLKGWEELTRELEGLTEKLQRKALQKGVRAGANLVRDTARQLAPRRTEGYTASIRKLTLKQVESKLRRLEKHGAAKVSTRKLKGTKSYRFRKAGTLKRGIQVGTPKDFKKTAWVQMGAQGYMLAVGLTKDAYYGKWIHDGWVHKTSKTGRVTHIPGKPFLKIAYWRNQSRVLNLIRQEVHKELEKLRRAA